MTRELETRLKTIDKLDAELKLVQQHLGRALSLASQMSYQTVQAEGRCLHSSLVHKTLDDSYMTFCEIVRDIRPHIRRIRNRVNSKIINHQNNPT
jgi:phosphoglycerate-specific signal transduction histidine kinase